MVYFCVLILPFLSFLSLSLFGRFLGSKGCCLLSNVAIFISFLFAVLIFFETSLASCSCTIFFINWFHCELFFCPWSFVFDSLSSVLLLIVLTVSLFVHLYSTEYMAFDPHQSRFMAYLSLFTGFMIIFSTADNFIIMFLGWEGIGLASFLLIGFWYNRIQAGKSALKAMIVNRFGDLGIVLAVCLIFVCFKSIDYFVVLSLIPSITIEKFTILSKEFYCLDIISLLLFWGSLSKSAQLGLHIWLPDAMEGPTPVSALIHAATLVTAGIFLIIRCSFFFENSTSLSLIMLVGAITAFFASSVGLVQNDLKRVIAFSTCSQLGYMTLAIGLSQYSAAFFHLSNHALFKALLFLSAGCIIHGLNDEQDLRKFGGLVNFFPFTFIMFVIGSLTLAGLPFLSGFYSKDFILESAFVKNNFFAQISYFLSCCAIFNTSFYSFRLIFLTFLNNCNSYKVLISKTHEGPILLKYPLFFLGLGALFIGFLTKDMFIGLGSSFFSSSLIVFVANYSMADGEFLPIFIKLIPFAVTFCGIFFSYIVVYCNSTINIKLFFYQFKMFYGFRKVYTFLIQKWHFDQVFMEIITVNTVFFGYKITFQLIDKGFVELLGPFNLAHSLNFISARFSWLQSGFLINYLIVLLFGLFLSLIFFILYYFVLFFDFIIIFFCYCFLSLI